MSRPSKRQLAILVVGLAVVLAGCTGGGGGGDGDGDGGPTVTATPTDATDSDTSTDGDGDGGGGETSTATATTTDGGATTDDGGGEITTDPGGTATPTKTADETPSGGDSGAQAHEASLREAGSYTLRMNLTSLGTTSRGGTVTEVSTAQLTGTQKAVVDTGELYGQWSSDSFTSAIEYYVPPNSDTAYQHFGERTREVPRGQALFLNFTSITQPDSQMNNQLVTNFSAYGEAGTGSTPLGPATKYVIDDTAALPEGSFPQYDSVESVDMTLWVDRDTGIIAKYQYQYTVVVGGETVTLDGVIAIESVGSTTIEKPDWMPE